MEAVLQDQSAEQANRRREGLTLVEVVIAVGILLISMGALLWAFVGSKQSSTLARNRVMAMENARNELEWLRGQSYTIIVPSGPVPLTNALFAGSPTNAFFAGLEGQKQITVSTNSGYKEVMVTITWRNPGRPQTSTLINSSIFFDSD